MITKSGFITAIREMALERHSSQFFIWNAPTLARVTAIEGQADLVRFTNLNPFSSANLFKAGNH